MIITRSPLRISIAGGGTDLESFIQSLVVLLFLQQLTHMYISQLINPLSINI